jgi:hypothetical protein
VHILGEFSSELDFGNAMVSCDLLAGRSQGLVVFAQFTGEMFCSC